MQLPRTLGLLWELQRPNRLFSAYRGVGRSGPTLLSTMKTLAFFSVLISLLVGCATTPDEAAYKTLSATSHIVYASMQGWGDWVRAGKAKPMDEVKVKAAYEKYQGVMRIAHEAVLRAHDSEGPDLNIAMQDVDVATKALVQTIELLTRK